MRSLRLLSVLFIAVLFCGSAFGATFNYNPAVAAVTVKPGFEVNVPLAVSVTSGSEPVSYYLWFMDSMQDGNLPGGWVSAMPFMSFIDSASPRATTVLTVRVPEGTAAGSYSGFITPIARGSHSGDVGRGLFLEVTVPDGCQGAPAFQIDSFGPSVIWPPNGRLNEFTVSGSVVLPEGCNLLSAGYVIEDEYGVYDGTGDLTVSEDGTFTITLPVEASRKGQDKDGRLYLITLFAGDDAGTTISGEMRAVVPHDRRN